MVYQRSSKTEKRFQVHTFLTAEEKAVLVGYAEEQGLSQSAAIRQLILQATEDREPEEVAV